VLITGGTRGIGRESARCFARRGARVTVSFLGDSAAAEETCELIRADGGVCQAVRSDVRDLDAVKDLVKEACTGTGGLDVLVNNAGILKDNLLTFMSDEEWDPVLDTNLRGTWYCIKVAARVMMRAKRGAIVNVSSDAGLLGDAMRANYSAAKAGVLGLTRTAARELAKSGIRVNAVAPGIIQTDMTADMKDARRTAMIERIPTGRFGTASEVAEVIAFLASAGSSYTTGQVWSVDGGLRM